MILDLDFCECMGWPTYIRSVLRSVACSWSESDWLPPTALTNDATLVSCVIMSTICDSVSSDTTPDCCVSRNCDTSKRTVLLPSISCWNSAAREMFLVLGVVACHPCPFPLSLASSAVCSSS